MSARVWTREELDRVHPLPEGLHWYPDGDGEWSAQPIDDDLAGDISCFVWNGGGRIVLVSDGTSPEVALSVALVHMGLDSIGAIAVALRDAAVSPDMADPGFGAGLRFASEMVRRGTVTP